MARIKKDVIISGKDKSEEVEITIDTGADVSFMNKEHADEFGLEYTGEKQELTLADGRRIQSEIAQGIVDIPNTCCRSKAKFAIVNENNSGPEILLGNDYMEEAGMKIDMTKKNEYNVECDCGSLYEDVKDIQDTMRKITPEELNKILNKVNEEI